MQDFRPILIVDAARACSIALCTDLVAMLRKHFDRPIRVAGAIIANLPAEASVLLVRSECEPLFALLGPLRRRFARAGMIGLPVDVNGHAEDMLKLLALGADDFLCPPVRPVDLVPRVQRLIAQPDIPESEQPQRFPFIMGRSRALLRVIDKVPCIARSEATCILYGETGSGKELFARAIHYSSPRSSAPFVPVNCGALPDSLLENELFGHAKGAYTDACSKEEGLLSMAEHGTLFLDEVDTLHPAAQVKLLRLLQDREYRPLGSTHTTRADVRILAATNTDLRLLVASRHFREDLFHRLNVLYLDIPSLRERLDDIPELAHVLVSRYSKATHPHGLRLSVTAVHRLMSYSWPGNVRELESVLQRAVVLAAPDAVLLQPADIDLPREPETGEPAFGPLREAKRSAVRQFEHSYLVGAMAGCGGNVSRAALVAGMERRGFQRLLQKHAIDRRTFLPARAAAARA